MSVSVKHGRCCIMTHSNVSLRHRGLSHRLAEAKIAQFEVVVAIEED